MEYFIHEFSQKLFFFFLKGNKGLEVTATLYERHCGIAEPEGEEKGCVLPRRLLSETG